jgi:predicted enzyme related to lactoylglutathione lyase
VNLQNSKIGQVLIPVTDLDSALTFYRDVLGIPFLFVAPPLMAFFVCGGVRLLVGVPAPGQAQRSSGAVYFDVGDIHGVFAGLSGQGVRFASKPHVVHRTPSSELWLAEFTDPDGNQLALMSEVSAMVAQPSAG